MGCVKKDSASSDTSLLGVVIAKVARQAVNREAMGDQGEGFLGASWTFLSAWL